MNRLIVDANIVMSLLITPTGRTAAAFAFIPVPLFTHSWLLKEVEEHWSKVMSLTKIASTAELDRQWMQIKSHITFIEEEDIPLASSMHAGRILAPVDPDDAPYFALALHLDCPIWTGDPKLRNALSGIHPCYSSGDLVTHFRINQITKTDTTSE